MSDQAKHIDELAQKIAREEVLVCLSSIVSDCAKGYGENLPEGLAELGEEAFELCTPLEDWEEAAQGYQVRHDLHGFYWLSDEEAKEEDEGAESAGFDGRAHFDSEDEAWRDCCEENGLDPYQWEIFEHWAVTAWLAGKLEAKGERVGDFGNLKVWGRSTTGQAIYMDSVIQAIARDLDAVR